MRILIAHSRYRVPGGEETYLEHITPALVRAGHEVASLIGRVPEAPGTWARLQLAGRMLWSRESARAVGELAARFRPDILHVHNLYPGLSPSVLWAARRRGAAVVLHLHNARLVCPAATLRSGDLPCRRCLAGEGGRIPWTMWNALARNCRGNLAESGLYAGVIALHRALGSFESVDAFIAPSRFLGDVLIAGGLPRERIHWVPNFTLPAAVGEAAEPAGATGVPYALYAGRIASEKGLPVLLEAMAGTHGMRLVAAGDGPWLAEARALVARAGLPVDLPGRLDRPSLGRMLLGARCVVLPSLVEENAPFTALEALAAGRPLIASAVGGLPELVGDAGVLVPPGDACALRVALEHIVGSPERAHALGEQARRRSAAYRLDLHLERLKNVYAQAIQRRRRAAGAGVELDARTVEAPSRRCEDPTWNPFA